MQNNNNQYNLSKTIHFLHIGKNAGTEIGRYMDAINIQHPHLQLVHHPHDTMLRHLPANETYFFSIRHPISRFISGFYSRKRNGYPRTYAEWSSHEQIAFSEFEHANCLAEALFSNEERENKAVAAIKSIRHTAQNQSDWFIGRGNFLAVNPPLFIIRQEYFDKDMQIFQSRLGIHQPIKLMQDFVLSHKNDYTSIPDLSALAKKNLTEWYSQDISFYRMCNDWIVKNST